MTATTPALDLRLERFIRATPDRVFDAFVTRELMERWMCPRGMTTAAEVDARVGGRYRLTMHSRGGESFVAAGRYETVERPRRLVFTWQWENGPAAAGETRITVTFEAREGGTALQMHHGGFVQDSERDAHADGWDSTFARLAGLLDERGSAAVVELVGDARSSYTWSARLALAEKGVAYTFSPGRPHSAEMLALHPFGRIPAFRDGGRTLFETSAIIRYVDEAFDGPPLLPGTIVGRARCEQWASAIRDYVYDTVVRRYVLQHVLPRGADGQPDRGVIDRALAEIPAQLAVFDHAYRGADFLCGATPTLADLLLVPIVSWLEVMPDGARLLADAPGVRRAVAAFQARDSFRTTDPRRA